MATMGVGDSNTAVDEPAHERGVKKSSLKARGEEISQPPASILRTGAIHRALAPSVLHVWLSQEAASAAASSATLPLLLLPCAPAAKRAGTNVTNGGAASVISGGARSAVLNVEGLLSVGDGG